MAIREDEDVAQAVGINLVATKLLAYGLGAVFGGVGGAIFAVMLGSVFPHSFQLLISINVLVLIILGGIGSQWGVVVGAVVLVGLPELLREFGEFRFLVYGVVLVAMMLLRPEGLVPSAAQQRELREGSAHAGPGTAAYAAPPAGG
jgi:branched-chain amino acid transport system permease protein